MSIFGKNILSRSRKYQEAHSALLMKSAGTIYNACFFILLTLPANILLNSYMKDTTVSLYDAFVNVLDVLAIIAFIFVVPLGLIAFYFEEYALNSIDKWAEKDSKKESSNRALNKN